MSTRHPSKTWPTMTDALLEMVAASGLSYPQLETATGLQRASLKRFAEGTQSLRLDKADKLARFLGLRIVEARPAKPKRRTSTKGARRATKRKKGG